MSAESTQKRLKRPGFVASAFLSANEQCKAFLKRFSANYSGQVTLLFFRRQRVSQEGKTKAAIAGYD
ncbi:hypothetical protein CHL76_11020 [Marinococcus halophilus]|nr:hypothetical protein CHL76_11020 [Marinococcus halophilus]